MNEVTIFIAFFAGILTFLSPCIFPLIPGFISYLAGTGAHDNKEGSRKRNIITAFYFVLGFSVIFSLIGLVIGQVFGVFLNQFQRPLQILGGILIVFFGFFIIGIIKPAFLQREFKLHPQKPKLRYLGAFLFGAAFSIGWTPCMGPILGTILTIAVTEPQIAFFLMFAFSLGLGFPFILTGIFANETLNFIRRSKTFFKYFNIIVGILIIILGLLLISGLINVLSAYTMPIVIF
jgi:cytochrome c-type biogenesis protein